MGYDRCHAIAVTTSYDQEKFYALRYEIAALGETFTDLPSDVTCARLVTPVVGSLVNGYLTFFIAPDGSKEGWSTSDVGDEFREAVVQLLNSHRYDDGSSWVKWCEVRFGDIDGKDKLVRSSASRVTAKGDVSAAPGCWPA